MKVLHILGYDELKFNVPLVEMLSNEQLGWEDEFYFATNNIKLYNTISGEKNVVYFEKGIAVYINKIWKKYDLIVIQGWNESVIRASVLKKEAARKIVWRFWGSDNFPYETEKNWKSKILGYIFFKRLCVRISNLYGIGYGGITDVKLIKERFHVNSELKKFPLGFSYEKGRGKEYQKLYQYSKNIVNNSFRIMVGHSANVRENHLVTLERLKKFKHENLKIVLVLSYGVDQYRRKVISKAKELFGEEKLEIYTDMMPLNEYIKFLCTIDAIAIESMGSNALGNITNLAYFGKKIYIKKQSFLDEYLTEMKVEHFFVDDISNMSFEEFCSKNYDIDANHKVYLSREDDENNVKEHKLLYDEYRRKINEWKQSNL